MIDCPHCGEGVPEDAVACPHCGSDFETGWNPEADYYSIELPEDDDDLVLYPEGSHPSRSAEMSTFLPAVYVLIAAGLFLWMGRRYEGPGHVFVFLALALCSWFFFRWPKRSG